MITCLFRTILLSAIVSVSALAQVLCGSLTERYRVQLRAEWFNWTNTPKFGNPSSGIDNLLTNADGSFRGGVFEVTGTNSAGREPNGDRILRLGVRVTF